MKKYLLHFLMIIMIVSVSCGGKKPKLESFIVYVKPENVKLAGALSEYLQIVDSSYTVSGVPSETYTQATISVKIKALKSAPKKLLNNLDKTYLFCTLNLLDENNTAVIGTKEFTCEDYSKQIESLLKKGNGEALIELGAYLGDTYDKKNYTLKSKKFIINTEIRDKSVSNDLSSKSEESSNDDASQNNSSDDEIDIMLNDYEKLMDTYVNLYAKVKKGDNSVLNSISTLTKRSNKLAESLKNAQNQNKMSSEQITRYIDITTKATEAMNK